MVKETNDRIERRVWREFTIKGKSTSSGKSVRRSLQTTIIWKTQRQENIYGNKVELKPFCHNYLLYQNGLSTREL